MDRRALTAACLILAAACGTKSPTTPSEVTSAQALVQQLEGRGATVITAELMPRESNPFFSVNGRRIVVNGENVTVFEYADQAAVDADAGRVHPAGTPIGATQITWVAPPRFYKSTRLIVIYTGTSGDVPTRLEAVLGRPFAGVR